MNTYNCKNIPLKLQAWLISKSNNLIYFCDSLIRESLTPPYAISITLVLNDRRAFQLKPKKKKCGFAFVLVAYQILQSSIRIKISIIASISRIPAFILTVTVYYHFSHFTTARQEQPITVNRFIQNSIICFIKHIRTYIGLWKPRRMYRNELVCNYISKKIF